MRQADYAPYLEFVEKTPDMLNLNDPKKAQKSGRPLLFTEVAHDFASLCYVISIVDVLMCEERLKSVF